MITRQNQILIIIPARGGSKGIPNKNIIDLSGKPLITYTINVAKDIPNSQVYVTTDSSKIAAVSEGCGVKVIKRPKELAKDNTPMLDTLRHAVQYVEEKGFFFDIVVLLQPTSPFRIAKDVLDAISLFKKGKFTLVTAVTPIEHPLEWMYNLDNTGVLTPIVNTNADLRQNAKNLYRLCGLVYVTSRSHIISCKRFLSGSMGAVIIPNERSLDIDTPTDLRIARCLMR